MKKLLFLALLGLFLLPDHAHAQRRKRQASARLGATFGVKLGASYSNIVGYQKLPSDSSNFTRSYEGRFGITGGVLANYRFTDQLSLQGEVLYAPRGAKVLTGVGSTRVEEVFKLTYVDIPVLLKYNAKIFYVEAGGVVSPLLSSKYDEVSKKRVTNEVDGIKTLDIGYTLGVGVEMPQGGIFGVRYIRSSSAIGAGGPLAGPYTLENSSFQITGGYIFNHSAGRGRRR